MLKVFVDISDESFRAKLNLKTKGLTKNSHSLLQVSLAKFLSDYLFSFNFSPSFGAAGAYLMNFMMVLYTRLILQKE